MKALTAQVVIDGAANSFDKEYSYAIPESLREKAAVGCRVTVPFGHGNQKRIGMIVGIGGNSAENLKEILELNDDSPVLNDEMLKLCKAMAERTFCTVFDAVKAVLPVGLNYKFKPQYSVNEEFLTLSLLDDREKELYNFIKENPQITDEKLRKVFNDFNELIAPLVEKQAVIKDLSTARKSGDLTRNWLRVADCAADNPQKLTARQSEIFELVMQMGEVSVREAEYFTGVTSAVINALVKKGFLERFKRQEFRIPYRDVKPSVGEITLTAEQDKAYSGLKAEMDKEKPSVSMLYGVTGSGKTQVFLKLADYALSQGKSIIIMVPEIALTPQMIDIFTSRYGSKTAVFHSAMSVGQRMDEYRRVKEGKAVIAIGTRSAVFAPFSNIGLIVMDEEQEHTYKSERSPRYHARDIARLRASYHKALLCLASATPSVESYSMALSGRYKLFSLNKRYGNAVLPQVTTVDMRAEQARGNRGVISEQLANDIDDTLKQGKQAIILLNRRGHNTYVSCPSCGWVASCPNCSVSMTYHSANGRLMCHYCGHSEPKGSVCPECGGEHIRFMGIGTQKLEEELKLLFGKARILRLDADTTIGRNSYREYLTSFANGDYDIMVGTQMVAKGLDFPNVVLVGVIGADKAAYSEDYRSFERTFSLLTQVVGRAGRGDIKGKAVIQTSTEDNDLITLAAQQNYNAFYNEEILNRKLMVYPPYCDICLVWTQSSSRQDAFDAINAIFYAIKERIDSEYKDIKLIILGPNAPAVPKVNNKYRFKLLIKCKNNKSFRDMLRECTATKLKGDTAVYVDINPETVI